MFTVTVRIARRRAAPRPRPAPRPRHSPASSRSATVASLRDRGRYPQAADLAEPVPNIHWQGATRFLAVAAFTSTQPFKLARIVTFTHPLFQEHHPRGLARAD